MDDYLVSRTLEETPSQSPTAKAELQGGNDSEVLKGTLQLYGSFFAVALILFCCLRKRYPRVYNLRNWVDETRIYHLKSWVEDLRTPLAEDQHGYISWIWKVFLVTDSEMMDECGMDALCFTRVLDFGIRLSLVGMVNAIWLIPVYVTAEESPETDYIDDRVVSMSVSNLPSSSLRFIATVIGGYVVFGYTMYSMIQEFNWFFRNRYQFLSKRTPQNYSVYVRNVPEEYCKVSSFDRFFRGSSSGNVLDARLAIKTPNLGKKVAKREAVVENLEHQINVEEIKGVTPMRRSVVEGGQRENAIDALFAELKTLNKDISESINRIERQHFLEGGTAEFENNPETNETADATNEGAAGGGMKTPTEASSARNFGGNTSSTLETQPNTNAPSLADETSPDQAVPSNVNAVTKNGEIENTVGKKVFIGNLPTNAVVGLVSNTTRIATSVGTSAAGIVSNVGSLATSAATTAVTNVAESANALLFQEDGAPRNAGFVTFKTLHATQTAKQLIQYREPFAMEVLEAPQPEDVLWSNVGRSHHDLQVVKLISLVLTTLLCVFWTIPMTFIASLSSVQSLREVDWINDLLNKYPSLETALEQLAPLILIGVNEILKLFTRSLSMLEGPVSMAAALAGSFSKLAVFMIIQNFFVSALSGGILKELYNIAQQPTLAVELLANSLPTQSTFFIQLLLVDTCVGMGIELLRISALAQASLRSLVGPNLTEKERNLSWMYIRPLADPLEFEQDYYWSFTVLYFMVYFVYATIAPITTFFMGICFFFRSAGYRHQFIYIYKKGPDSGGKLWVSIFRIIPTCMIIAQLTIVGLLALKKAAVASVMMFPLLIVTILFYIYISQQHFRLSEQLPVSECLTQDARDNAEGSTQDHDSLRGRYVQPEFREKEVYPDNMTPARAAAQGLEGDVSQVPEEERVEKAQP